MSRGGGYYDQIRSAWHPMACASLSLDVRNIIASPSFSHSGCEDREDAAGQSISHARGGLRMQKKQRAPVNRDPSVTSTSTRPTPSIAIHTTRFFPYVVRPRLPCTQHTAPLPYTPHPLPQFSSCSTHHTHRCLPPTPNFTLMSPDTTSFSYKLLPARHQPCPRCHFPLPPGYPTITPLPPTPGH